MLNLDSPAAAAVPTTGRGRLRAQEEFWEFAVDRGYLALPSAVAFAEWLVDDWHGFVEGDRELTVRHVLASAFVYWCGGTDPTLCVHGDPMDAPCPTCGPWSGAPQSCPDTPS